MAEMETVVLDDQYDLTLIVGRKHIGGAKAFCINKGSLRNTSPAFKAKLNGNWAENHQTELTVDGDSAYAFQILLQIVHWKFQDLPKKLTKAQLVEFAKFCVSWNVQDVVTPFVQSKNWLSIGKGPDGLWEKDIVCQDLILVTHTFKKDSYHNYLLNALAMRIMKNEVDNSKFYVDHGVRISLRTDMPAAIIGKRLQ